jgi:hypothetical protein
MILMCSKVVDNYPEVEVSETRIYSNPYLLGYILRWMHETTDSMELLYMLCFFAIATYDKAYFIN